MALGTNICPTPIIDSSWTINEAQALFGKSNHLKLNKSPFICAFVFCVCAREECPVGRTKRWIVYKCSTMCSFHHLNPKQSDLMFLFRCTFESNPQNKEITMHLRRKMFTLKESRRNGELKKNKTKRNKNNNGVENKWDCLVSLFEWHDFKIYTNPLLLCISVTFTFQSNCVGHFGSFRYRAFSRRMDSMNELDLNEHVKACERNVNGMCYSLKAEWHETENRQTNKQTLIHHREKSK